MRARTTTWWACAACAPTAPTSTSSWSCAPGKGKAGAGGGCSSQASSRELCVQVFLPKPPVWLANPIRFTHPPHPTAAALPQGHAGRAGAQGGRAPPGPR